MRITIVMGFFLPVPPVRGGSTEKIWSRLARHFADAGHEVTLVSRTWENWPRRESDRGLTILRLPGRDHTRRLWTNLLLDLWWSLKVLRHLPPGDIVVSNNVSLPIFCRALRPSAGRVAVVLGRMPKGQTRAYGNVDRLLATSQAVADQARRENSGLAERTIIFPNPIDWPLHQAARQQAASGRPLTFGFVGRIHPEKGIEQLLAAAERLLARPDLPAWRGLVIGPSDVALGGGGPEYLAQLKEFSARRLGGRVEFIPPIFDPTVLARRYGEMDIFCYPTLAEKGEGLSIAPIEAMAAGAVPVLSRLDCYADLLRPGENGCYFDHRGAEPARELADLLAGLLTDAPRRRQLSLAAQVTARRYDYRESAARLLADFAQLTGSAPGPSSAP
jgi:glycosyltransferase involved in cell wall biosynthesis